LTPIGFLGSLLIPPWLIVVGIWLFWKSKAAVPFEPPAEERELKASGLN
jgi:hypothetical protein